MLTDLRLHKYLEGQLSAEESKEIEALLAKNPELQARLEALKNQSQVLGMPTWQRLLNARGSRKGSRTRYTTLLPALLMLMVVLMVTQHWFSRPGENSTFTMNGGNGTALELLYNAPSGWRYLDKDFKPTDSLSISVRDTGTYHVIVMAVYGRGPDAEVVPLLADAGDRTYAKSTAKPVFTLSRAGLPGPGQPSPSNQAPNQIIVFYRNKPLPELTGMAVLDILASHGNERGGLDFQYQIFSAGR